MCFFFCFLNLITKFEVRVCLRLRPRRAHSATCRAYRILQWLHRTTPLLTSRRFSTKKVYHRHSTGFPSRSKSKPSPQHRHSTGNDTRPHLRGNPQHGNSRAITPNILSHAKSTSKFKQWLFQTEIAGAQHPKPNASNSAG